MKRFDFRLESALKWRDMQLQHEQETLNRFVADELRAQETLQRLRDDRDAVREQMRQSGSIDGLELRALASYLAACEPRERALSLDVSVKAQRAAEQRRRVVEAERRVRLIQKLRDRQLAEWTTATERQMDSTAQDTWTAVRQHNMGQNPELRKSPSGASK